MTQSDFAWVNFNHTFTPATPTATRNFQVDSPPIEAGPAGADVRAVGYVLVQAFDVENTAGPQQSQHRILINGVDLPDFDIPVEGGAWQTWMDHIPPGVLAVGNNTIRIIHGGADADGFRVANVAIHWREAA
jgi:hypothetical protein